MDTRNLSDVIAELDLPNPVTPMPLERFQDYKESEDVLERAAFWAFYCAWEHDHLIDRSGASTQVTRALAVEARNDGHVFVALKRYLHLTDCVLVRSDQLTPSKGVHTDDEAELELESGAWLGVMWLVMALLAGIFIGAIVW